MEPKEVLELITALVDNEIETKDKAKEIQLIIQNNQKLNLEYQLQNFIKSTIRLRVPKVEPPEYLKQKIIKNIIKELETDLKKNKPKPRLINLIYKPVFAFSVFILLLAAFFFFSQNKLYDSIFLKQKDKTNMFNQALQNFQSVIEGNLSAQIFPGNAEEIKTFFKKQGMNCEFPSAKNWHLTGAAISEIDGGKFAHNIYRNALGKTAYLYQANMDFLIKQKIINLSDDLIKMVNNGKCYKYEDKNKSAIVWKCRNNICILVSNDRIDNLDQFTASR